jgi:hypothetical protein
MIFYNIGVIDSAREGPFWAILKSHVKYTNETASHMHTEVEVVYRHKQQGKVTAEFLRTYAPPSVCRGCAHDDTCHLKLEELTDEGLCRNRKEPLIKTSDPLPRCPIDTDVSCGESCDECLDREKGGLS